MFEKYKNRMTAGETSVPPIAPAGSPWHPFEITAIASLTSVIAGSALVATFLFFFSSHNDTTSLLTMWLIYVIYSGFIVVPASLAVAFPLMLVFRTSSNWVWLGMCLGAAAVFATIAATMFQSQIFLQALIFTSVYALIFAGVAIWLRSRR